MKYSYLLFTVLFISGCYTMFNHPEVEVYYERENGEEYLTEDYDVFVDEDCTTCHDSFIAQKHFTSMIPAHDVTSNWDDLPWWLDTKYLMFFHEDSDDSSSSSGNYGYQHVGSQSRTSMPPLQQGGTIVRTGGSSSTTSGSQNATKTDNQVNEGSSSNTKSRSGVSNNTSSRNSRSSDSSSKRKFRKRK